MQPRRAESVTETPLARALAMVAAIAVRVARTRRRISMKKQRLEVGPHHRGRKAVVYVRQVVKEPEAAVQRSIEEQHREAASPADWGWPPQLITVVDGHCGPGGDPSKHPEFARLVHDLRGGIIGAIFLTKQTRFAGLSKDWWTLLAECRAHDVLVVIDGHICDIEIALRQRDAAKREARP